MQELRRGVEMEEKENLKELEEETAANLVKSKYLVAVNKPEEGQSPENVQVPYIKTQNGDSDRSFPMQKNSENSIKRINLLQCW